MRFATPQSHNLKLPAPFVARVTWMDEWVAIHSVPIAFHAIHGGARRGEHGVEGAALAAVLQPRPVVVGVIPRPGFRNANRGRRYTGHAHAAGSSR